MSQQRSQLCYPPRAETDRKKINRLAVLSLAGIYVPCLIISFSQGHMQWVSEGVTSYVPSFYSYFFLVIFILCAAIIIYGLPKSKNIKLLLRIVITAAVFIVSLSGAVLNDVWREAFCEKNIRYKNFDHAVSSEEFILCDDNYQIYAPDNPGIHNLQSYTEDYLKIYNPSDVKYFYKPEDLLPDREILCMRMPENYSFAVIAKTDEQMLSEKVVVRTVSQDPVDLTLYLTDGSEISFTDATDGTVITAPTGLRFNMNIRVIT